MRIHRWCIGTGRSCRDRAARFQVSGATRFQVSGLRGSRFQGYAVSGFRGYAVSGFRAARFQVPGPQITRILGYVLIERSVKSEKSVGVKEKRE